MQIGLAEAQGYQAESQGSARLSQLAGWLTVTSTRHHQLRIIRQEIIPPTDTANRHFLDLVRRLLTFDPAQRITVREALHHPYFTTLVPEEC